MNVKDRNGNVIAKGDKVIWYDPQTEYRDLSRVWVIEEINEEMAFISDEFGECECLPTEIAKVEDKKHYQILVRGNFGVYGENIIDVLCTKEELDIVAKSLTSYVRSLGCGVCCVAKEGEGVSNSDFDIMFADCM